MSFAHLTLPTQDVETTAAFFEETLGFSRGPIPGNSPVPTEWLDMGGGQLLHIVFVEAFEASRFEGEFGRHIAVFYPRDAFDALKARLISRGAEIMTPLRASSLERFFFREPINGYVFEVIASS
jgi:catechol 2,3-dioxygenase-like lactoylglutathione lyase family enzyme